MLLCPIACKRQAFARLGVAAELERSVALDMRQLTVFILLIIPLSFLPAAEEPVYIAEHSGSCGTWQVEFYKSGYAHETSKEFCGDKSDSYYRLHRISSKDFEAIRKVLVNVKFHELPDSIELETIVTDEDYYSITVGTRDKRKSVFGSGLERAVDPNHAQRFMEIWHEINTIVKEPAD